MKWLPIDTAPKDGTEILAYGSGAYAVLAWGYTSFQLVHIGGYAEDSDWIVNPTHWIPLPKPPDDVREKIKHLMRK